MPEHTPDKQITIEKAIVLVGGKRKKIHTFDITMFGLYGADLDWDKFERILKRAEKIVETWGVIQRIDHPVAILCDGVWKLYGKKQ